MLFMQMVMGSHHLVLQDLNSHNIINHNLPLAHLGFTWCVCVTSCKLVRMTMALLRYFKPTSSLPRAKDTGLGEAPTCTKQANAVVQRVLTKQLWSTGGTCNRKLYTSFSDEQRATIGRYTAKHSNTAAVKKFKGDFELGLGESTV